MDYFLTDEEIKRYKAFLGFNDFIIKNNLTNTLNRTKSNIYENLNSNYIGFVNLDGTSIVYRNVVEGSSKFRYYNYNILNMSIPMSWMLIVLYY